LKLVFLILVIFTGDGKLKYEKVPFIISSLKSVTCEDMFYKTVKFVDNPNYEQGNNQVWVLIKYKDQNVIAHFCKDKKGNYVR
jgi:hypothetical protein